MSFYLRNKRKSYSTRNTITTNMIIVTYLSCTQNSSFSIKYKGDSKTKFVISKNIGVSDKHS